MADWEFLPNGTWARRSGVRPTIGAFVWPKFAPIGQSLAGIPPCATIEGKMWTWWAWTVYRVGDNNHREWASGAIGESEVLARQVADAVMTAMERVIPHG